MVRSQFLVFFLVFLAHKGIFFFGVCTLIFAYLPDFGVFFHR